MNWKETRLWEGEVTFDKKDMDNQAEVSFKAGMKEGIKRCCDYLVARQYIAAYNLDRFMEYLEEGVNKLL